MSEHTPGPWTTNVVVASSGLERTRYAHQIVKGGHTYTVAHTDHKNFDRIHIGPEDKDGCVCKTGIGRREPDLTPHPDAVLIAAAPEMAAEIERLRGLLDIIQDEDITIVEWAKERYAALKEQSDVSRTR